MYLIKNHKIIFDFGILLFLATFLIISCQYTKSERLIPLIIAVPTFLSQLVLTIIHIRSLNKVYYTEDEEGAESTSNVLRIIYWIVGFSTLIFLFGFYPSLIVFSFLFLSIEGEVPRLKAVVSAGMILCSIYILFGFALQIKLWPGFIPEIVPSFLGGGILPPL